MMLQSQPSIQRNWSSSTRDRRTCSPSLPRVCSQDWLSLHRSHSLCLTWSSKSLRKLRFVSFKSGKNSSLFAWISLVTLMLTMQSVLIRKRTLICLFVLVNTQLEPCSHDGIKLTTVIILEIQRPRKPPDFLVLLQFRWMLYIEANAGMGVNDRVVSWRAAHSSHCFFFLDNLSNLC